MNLLDTVKGYLGNETVERIAGMLGIEPDAAKAAIGAAAPTLLAGVAQTANTGQDGARRVAAAVDGVDDAVLGDGVPAVATGDATSAAQGGMATISRLFGGGTATGITEAISRYTGLGGGAAGKVIGLIAPIVLGAIKRQKTTMGLDAGGLANLLSSQKSSFLSAIPSGLSGMLSSVPGLSGLAGTATGAAGTAREYATSAAGEVRDAGYRAAETAHHHARSSYAWALPAAICALLAIGLWWWMGHRTESEQPRATVPQQPAPVVTPAPRTAPEETAEPAGARINPAVPAAESATGLTTQVSDIFSSATNTFSQVRDAASAEAAVPKVDAINKQLDALAQSAKSMPTSTRTALSTTIRQWRDKLQPVTDKALAAPGVGETLRPKVDDMYKKMDALMMAQ